MKNMVLISALLVAVLSSSASAQTVDRAGKSEALISAQGSEVITLNEELLFLSEDLDVIGRGQVIKVSESGKTAVVKITSGKAMKGMSVEKATARKAQPKSADADTGSPYRPNAPASGGYSEALTKEDREVLRYGPVENTQYVLGGIFGTWLGFGLGHAIQGRYGQSGWIFTAGQVGSGAVVMVGALRCFGQTLEGRCTDPIATLGTAAFIGFKIWEIVDLWVTPPNMNDRYRELRRQPSSEEPAPASPALTFDGMILPTKDGVTAGLRMTF